MPVPRKDDPKYNPHAGKGGRAGQLSADWDKIRENLEKIDWRKPPSCYKKFFMARVGPCCDCDFKVKCEKVTEK